MITLRKVHFNHKLIQERVYMNLISLMFSSTFFTGFLPGKIISKDGAGGGLMGSIVGFFIQLYFIYYGFGFEADILLILFSFVLGLICVEKAEKYMFLKYGKRKRHTGELVDYDYNQTNIDEVHGQAIAGLPIFFFNLTFSWQVTMLMFSFIAFRIFDVSKPWPIKLIERNIKGSFGIMFDDTIAGLMAGVVVIITYLSF